MTHVEVRGLLAREAVEVLAFMLISERADPYR